MRVRESGETKGGEKSKQAAAKLLDFLGVIAMVVLGVRCAASSSGRISRDVPWRYGQGF